MLAQVLTADSTEYVIEVCSFTPPSHAIFFHSSKVVLNL